MIKKPSIHNSLPLILRSQEGQSSAFIIIFIVVIVFAVMMSGGAASLFSGNEASPDLTTETPEPTTDTVTPSASSSASTPGPTNSAGWNVAVTLGSCNGAATKEPFMTGSMKVTGTANGYVQLEVDGKSVGNQSFTAPTGNFPLELSNTFGFNNKPWKAAVYSGGTVKATYNGAATNCK